MVNEVATQPTVSYGVQEHVLGTGDLSKLSTQQRVALYQQVCRDLGLNPLTRPFRFLTLNGQVQLYATKDCTDQLRSLRGISLTVKDRVYDGDVYTVTCAARMGDRLDEDVGAVTLPSALKGESRANAVMKAVTKAKRRVTLSICGLGYTDESELDQMPGASTFDAEEEPPKQQSRAAEERGDWDRWLDRLEGNTRNDDELNAETWDEFWNRGALQRAANGLQGALLQRFLAIKAAAFNRIFPVASEADDAEPEPELGLP